MPAYKAPLREFRYVLHDVLDAEAHYRALGRDDINAELIDGVLEGAARFAEDVVAPTNEPGDRVGVRRSDDGRVITPPGFVEAYRQYVDDGWAALCGPVEAGGQGLAGEPRRRDRRNARLRQHVLEALQRPDRQRRALRREARDRGDPPGVYLPKLVSGVWSGTMVLTEPHAGTDLGLMRTRAEPDGQGSYRISGTKIFITSGEHDLTENIVHLVLAKLPDAPAGSRGISMFLVPKLLPDARARPARERRQLCERRAQARHPRLRDLRHELRQFARLADRRGQRRPQDHVHDDESRAALGRAAGARAVRARLAGLARLRARAPAGPDFRRRQGPRRTRSSAIPTCGACCSRRSR